MKRADLLSYSLEVVRYLSVTLGARPAGSANEAAAFDYLENQLQADGCQTWRQPFQIASLPRFEPLYSIVALLLISAGLIFERIPWLAVFMPFLIFALPQITRLNISIKKKALLSQNLIAEINPHGDFKSIKDGERTIEDEDVPCLIFCAHTDSARANAITDPGWLRLFGNTYFYIHRIAIFAGALGLLKLLGFLSPQIVDHFVAILCGVAGGGWLLMEILSQSKVRYSPGAYDNGAAVAVMTALAHYYSQQKLQSMRLAFLFSGAEENGMLGAEEFTRLLPDKYGKNVAVLNLDLLGSGERIEVVTLDGTILPRHTDANLNRMVREVDSEARSVWYTRQSGDYLPFLKKGIPATSVQTGGNSKAQFSYHTIYDDISLIQENSMENILDFCIRFVEKYQESISNYNL